jgi:membrane protease YdiL (CAAX protease family)
VLCAQKFADPTLLWIGLNIVRPSRDMPPLSPDSNLARRTLYAFAIMMLAWSIVWVAKRYLDAKLVWLNNDSASTIFWLVAKIAVWIVPAVMLLRLSGRDFASQVNLIEWRHWVSWGTAIGLIIAMTGIVPKLLIASPLLPSEIDFGMMNAMIVAPLFEEFSIRAAILGNLIPAFGFARANVVAAVCFVVLHIPGWYMMGSLVEKVSQPVGGALSVFILGLCLVG